MIRRSTSVSALFIAVLLCVAAPAAIQAADRAPTGTQQVDATPLNQNLLQNPGFETVGTGTAIPGWAVVGGVRVETFGTRSWPSPAYAQKWDGGLRYLTCARGTGLVRQTVNFTGWGTRTNTLLARFNANVGGKIGHKARVAILITGADGQQAYKEKVRVFANSNHYVRAVTTLAVPIWATSIQATIELLPADGAARCRAVADTLDLWVFPA